jgi:hypothetical protein
MKKMSHSFVERVLRTLVNAQVCSGLVYRFVQTTVPKSNLLKRWENGELLELRVTIGNPVQSLNSDLTHSQEQTNNASVKFNQLMRLLDALMKVMNAYVMVMYSLLVVSNTTIPPLLALCTSWKTPSMLSTLIILEQ